jgi:Fe-Mn family superoxide dismutase
MTYASTPLPFQNELLGISKKTTDIHHDKLYAGYVAKLNELGEKLMAFERGGDLSAANQTYSELRALKDGETFATNGVYLHEWYFEALGGNGEAPETLEVVDAIKKQFESFENFVNYFSACGMAARGWVVLAWDNHAQDLRVFTSDAHNQGGVWGAAPILVLDVYEHAYFIDHGADRKAYILDFWKNLNWQKINKLYLAARGYNQKYD